MFVKPAHVVARFCTWIDKTIFDGILHGSAKVMVWISKWDRKFDEGIVDGLVNLVGTATFGLGRSLRVFQTGQLRQYIMFIGVGVLALFVLLFVTFPK